jgi:hypothetical protein
MARDEGHLSSENLKLRISIAQNIRILEYSLLRLFVAQNIHSQNNRGWQYPYHRLSLAQNISS